MSGGCATAGPIAGNLGQRRFAEYNASEAVQVATWMLQLLPFGRYGAVAIVHGGTSMLDASSTNRISNLWGDSPAAAIPSVVSRSPAQREAARRNGAMSRGPISPEGKARSSANAIKHGVLARKITPPCDIRGDDRMFQKARQSLIHDLQPQTYSQHAAVDSLAHDFVVLARARAMVEAISSRRCRRSRTGQVPRNGSNFRTPAVNCACWNRCSPSANRVGDSSAACAMPRSSATRSSPL